MFDNIGGKIKTLAKVLCWIGIVGSVIAAIGFFTSGNGITGWSMLIAGPLASWISSFTLYALGEIADNSATQAGLIRKWAEREGIVEKSDEKNAKIDDEEEKTLLMKCPGARYDAVRELLDSNGIPKRIALLDFTSYTIYVRPADFQRARALIAEQFKDNPKVMKGLAPETPSDN